MGYIHGGDIYTYEGMTDFSVNTNPFGPSLSVIEAACRATREINAYPDSKCRKLRKALAESLDVSEDVLIFGNGAADLIFSLVFAERPQKAVMSVPSFAEYTRALEAVDCKVCCYYLKEENGFSLDVKFLDMLTEDVDIIFLCTPDNPTGNLIEMSLLIKIAEKCERLGIRMVLDECFCEFIEDRSQILTESAVYLYPHIFLLRAFTKMHSMPGLRLGYGITSDRKLLDKVRKVRQPWSVSGPAQAAGIAALGETDRIKKTREYVSRERNYLQGEFDRIGVEYVTSLANYILLKSHYDLFNILLQKNILIRDCSNYKGLGTGFYRIAVKTREENRLLVKALEDIYRERED